MQRDRDYVLGTHDDEIERLGLQHRVWRPRAFAAWQRAGFTAGQTLVDVGAGPGYATLDLAELTGPRGRVLAIERSRHFLDALHAAAGARGLSNIAAIEADLDTDLEKNLLPDAAADGAWVRWVFAFVKQPREVLRRVRRLLRPGAALVVHEYFDYRTWRLVPRSGVFENFVSAVMASWRANGGEPDIALDLTTWMSECGLTIRELRTHVDVITPSDLLWQWPKSFIATGTERMTELGYLTSEEAAAVRETFARSEADPRTRLVTPAVLEIVAEAV
jgi:SAM-dependent methyltransferase